MLAIAAIGVIGGVGVVGGAAALGALSAYIVNRKLRPSHAPDEPPHMDMPAGVHWAICGAGGAGKSSLVNAFMGLKPGEPGAAKVGVTETSVKAQSFDYMGIKLWDIPGGATLKFPAETYVEEFDLRHMSAVILVASHRPFEIDLKIITVLHQYNVPWFYVRTKLDVDITNNQYDNRKSAQDTVDEIRGEMAKTLKSAGSDLPADRIFVLSTRPGGYHSGAQWDALSNALCQNLIDSHNISPLVLSELGWRN